MFSLQEVYRLAAWRSVCVPFDRQQALIRAEPPVLLAMLDVTERERRRAALEEHTARLSSILASLPAAVVIVDDTGIIISFNPGAERIFGYSAGEVAGRNAGMLVPEPERGHILSLNTGLPLRIPAPQRAGHGQVAQLPERRYTAMQAMEIKMEPKSNRRVHGYV